MNGRAWTQQEVAQLYELAGRVSQRRAAKRLNRTVYAIRTKAIALGIYWWQGTWTYQSIADEVGCSPTSVRRLVRILFEPAAVRGAGKRGTTGWRSMLTEEQAQRVITVLRRARAHRAAKIKAGRARHGRTEFT